MNIDILFGQFLPFWKELPSSDKDLIRQGSRQVNYKKGTVLHRSEQECKGIMLIIKGQLRTYILSDEGREVTLFRVKEGDTCVLSASCLMDAIVFDVLIDAVWDTDAVMISSSVLSAVMQRNTKMELYLYKTASERFADVVWMMQQILFMGADKRVAVFLWDEMSRSGNSRLCYTHDEIARYIGSAREVVTKVLNYFSQEGVVLLGRGRVEVTDKEKLRKFV